MLHKVKILKPHYFDGFTMEKVNMWYNRFVNEYVIIDDTDIKYWNNYEDYMLPVVYSPNDEIQEILDKHQVRMSDTSYVQEIRIVKIKQIYERRKTLN